MATYDDAGVVYDDAGEQYDGGGATATFTIDGVVIAVIPTGFLLNGVALPRPVSFGETQDDLYGEMEMLDGRSKRDMVSQSVVYELEFKYLTATEAQIITDIVDLKTAVTFEVEQPKLIISQINVFPILVNRTYSVAGTDFRHDLTLNLVKAT
jgi:hypothetical protein